jgi:uncharacterized SAM-binding protein YcdF (DUF218 family)
MILFLSKFLAVLLYPMGLFFLGAAVAAIVAYYGKKRIALYCIAVPLALLWLFSTPLVADSLVRSLEKRYDPPQTFPKVSAIVLLGGCTEPAIPPRRYAETNVFGDRIFHTIRLARAQYAPYIVCSGGKIKFLLDFPGSEAATLAGILREFGGIDSSSIIIEDKAQNTRENATKTKEMLEKRGLGKDIILVTTSLHMYRSVKIFKKNGFTVYPAPTDYWVSRDRKIKLFDVLPSADALFFSTTALHEYYGLLAYWALGWL